jgi:hypothetical protein
LGPWTYLDGQQTKKSAYPPSKHIANNEPALAKVCQLLPLIRNHDSRFMALMDRHMPGWKVVRQMLNAVPLAHVDWKY